MLRTQQSCIIILMILASSITISQCVYNVPSYFGHFSRSYFDVNKIKNGTFRYFQYHYAVDLNNNNDTVYYANTKQHCIQKYNITSKTKSILAGRCGEPGDRVGGLRVMLLNNPTSVVSYQANQLSIQSQSQMRMFIVANQNCNMNDMDCILESSQASQMNLNMSNLRPYPPIIQFPPLNSSIRQYLYVSDTANHCIKKIDLKLQTSIVVAGQCGYSGFVDGPPGFNKLNKPTNLGISKQGILYFYDEGNQYMRKIDTNNQVFTLLNGACKFFGKSRKVGSYQLNNILCYDNWIQYKTKSSVQHIVDDSQINFCIQHSSKCR